MKSLFDIGLGQWILVILVVLVIVGARKMIGDVLDMDHGRVSKEESSRRGSRWLLAALVLCGGLVLLYLMTQ